MTQFADTETPLQARERFPTRALSLIASLFLVLVGAVFVYRRISGPEVAQIVARLDWRWLIAGAACYWMLYPLNALRLERVINWLRLAGPHPGPSRRLILKVTLSSGFVAAAVPLGFMVDVGKIGALRLFAGLSTTDAARCILFDRAVGTQWIGLFAVIVLPIQWALGIPIGLIVIEFLICGGVVAAVGAFIFMPQFLGQFRNRWATKVMLIVTGYSRLLVPRQSLLQLVIGLGNLVIVWGTLYCLLRAAGLSADPWLVGCFVPFLQLANSMPFLYMGWGGREIAMAATLGSIGNLSLSGALAVSAIWGFVLIVSGAINGVFLLGDWDLGSDKYNP